MIFISHIVGIDRLVPVVVEQVTEDGKADIILPGGTKLCVDRYFITTPVASCPRCTRPMYVKKNNKGQAYVECPFHAQHMHETTYAASHDVKNYSHDRRRWFGKQASRWGRIWNNEREKAMSRVYFGSKSIAARAVVDFTLKSALGQSC